ncbi:hypothetical protein [Limosilactobacillus fermentum]|uniref:hypothetical protein n=1 Tax=Limosilactobacillus fermentum TaxID=1613 RepID=UPI001432A296|nr:hypothetical protein [Limosilactobacillus fermentum]
MAKRLIGALWFCIVTTPNREAEIVHHLPLGQFAYEGSLANLTKIVDEIQGQKANAFSADRK